MKIGLIDVDGHRFPNLALMRISAYHKAQGDTVEWWWSDFIHYDIVYMSKIFSDAYTRDIPEPLNADKVIKGGGQDTASILMRMGGSSLTKAKTIRFHPKWNLVCLIILFIRSTNLLYQ